MFASSAPLVVARPLPDRTKQLAVFTIAILEVLAICVPPIWWGTVALSFLVVAALVGVVMATLQGDGDSLILGWILIFPLGYYYLSFPRGRALISLDRVFICLLMVAACLAGQQRLARIPTALRNSAVCWAAFLVCAAATLPLVAVPISGLRVLLDAFLFPGLLAWYVVRYFDVRKHLRVLHVIACVMALYVGAIGIAEVALQRDLLATPDSAIFLAGDYSAEQATQILIRPNGPFSSTNSFALIGLVSLCLIPFLGAVQNKVMPSWQRLLQKFALLAALLTAIMPLFRSVFVSLGIILLVSAYYSRGLRRFVRIAAISTFVLLALLVRVALPEVFAERSDPMNFYGRIAEQRQVLMMFLDHPIYGVGLNNFYYAAQSARYTTYYRDVESVDYPHNNLGAVLSETGILGFVPFVLSQLLLVRAFRRLCGGRKELFPVWITFLFIFLAYWVNGMSLESAYFSDLNLYYMCALAILFKYGMTGSAPRLNMCSSI